VNSVTDLIENIHARGGKVTPQRLMIYQLLEGSTVHPTAEYIHDQVKEVMPTVSLTTVYKSLNELVAIGELRRFDLNGVSHFDPNTTPHAEIICLGCGAVVDIPRTSLLPLPEIPEFDIVGQAQTFYGYCSLCREMRRQKVESALQEQGGRAHG